MSTITLPRAVVEQALEAIEDLRGYRKDIDEAITALRAALAQQQAEPIKCKHHWVSTGGMQPGEIRCIDCGAWARQRIEPVQEQVTYPTGGLQLEAGFYSADQLREMLKTLEGMNAAARRAMKEMT